MVGKGQRWDTSVPSACSAGVCPQGLNEEEEDVGVQVDAGDRDQANVPSEGVQGESCRWARHAGFAPGRAPEGRE